MEDWGPGRAIGAAKAAGAAIKVASDTAIGVASSAVIRVASSTVIGVAGSTAVRVASNVVIRVAGFSSLSLVLIRLDIN